MQYSAQVQARKRQSDSFGQAVTGYQAYLGNFERVIDYVSILKNGGRKVVETI